MIISFPTERPLREGLMTRTSTIQLFERHLTDLRCENGVLSAYCTLDLNYRKDKS